MTVLKTSLAVLLAAVPALGQLIAPCTPDANTLHLWHLDESAAPAQDSIGGGLPLQGLLDGATLGSSVTVISALVPLAGEDVVVSVPAVLGSGYQLQRSVDPGVEGWMVSGWDEIYPALV